MEKGLKNDPLGFFVEPVPESFEFVLKPTGAGSPPATNRYRHKIYFLMKCSFIVLATQLTFVSLLFADNLRSQDLSRRLTLHIEGANIKESLLKIEKESGVNFLLPEALMSSDSKKVSLHNDDISVKDAIAGVLSGTSLEYRLLNGYVVIARKKVPVKISGRVLEAKTKEPLPGVSVRIKNSSGGAVTDMNGYFTVEIPSEGAVLIFSLMGYEPREVKVTGGSAPVNILLNQSTRNLGEVQVQARRKTNTEITVLQERRNAAIVQDAISAQQIERTASITTTQALQRVSGVTITDDKYVAIRGLGDRSVIGQLNGVRLASSDPDRSAIPLDLVPASLLDNITIYKTVTPDKPADAAAGIVELKTKSVPDKATLEIIAQTGFNSNIGPGGRMNSFYNSDLGFLGNKVNRKNLGNDFLQLGQQYPGGLSQIQKLIAESNGSPAMQQEAARINKIMHSFDPVLTTRYKTAPLNQLYSATYGNSFRVFKNKTLGVVAGANYYRRTTDVYGGDLTQYSIYQGVITGNPDVYSPRNIPNYITPNSLFMGKYQTYKENTGTETLNYGVLAGLTFRFDTRNEISMQYMGSWGSEAQAINMYGKYEYTGLPGEVRSTIYSLKQTRRNLNTFNLQGEHKFLAGQYSPKLSYNLASSTSAQNDPDFRFVTLTDYKPRGGAWYIKPTVGQDLGSGEYVYTDHLYALNSGYVNGYGTYGIIQAEPNGRRWRRLSETNWNYKADLAFPFPLFGQKQEFKTGFNYLNRDRRFTENMMFLPGSNFSQNKATTLYAVNGNLDALVGPNVIGIQLPSGGTGEGTDAVGGFLYNTQKSPNNYNGFFETNAFYGMLDLHLLKNLRLAGGVRFERTNIQSAVDTANVFLDPSLTTKNSDGTSVPVVLINPNTVYKTSYKPYYAINMTYTYKEDMNFRVAYNTTLARPELRELTNVFEFDAFQMGLVVGNPKLVNQHTENLDFRWEWFPNPGEVISLSAFGKRINNQLVKVFSLQTEGLAAKYPEYPTIQFQNDPNTGTVWGLELELVKDLGRLTPVMKNFFIGSNLLLAQSNIRKTAARYNANKSLDRHTPENSPLFEQAPYSINGWLNYKNIKLGTDLTAAFNMVGERLVQINLTGEPDLYTRPAPTLDFIFSQQLGKRLLFKGYAKNILNPAIETVYANPGTGGFWYGKRYVNRSYKRGAEIMMGFTYKLF
ncbi:TonB-dependent receptor [Chitinophaga terrae (ex Kim and Jung 2007)]|uniref:TonB-dependent receptor n=2 Tax=Chitinophaga terrae (ex Kim and Jung 2007) TaxID=408074 RepID=A0A1H4EHB2_9BACT|nr:TonB-dependent receptor [Chitinophaga terrae (ex Kim and Jung 2007)]GEP91655.1 outer membrane protein [Chitinophaga terrae (ex Kim and Jung 2007)]SEA84471.1 TonB-dependent receptor [Chitinophaga terrae (ex Kim and Jung 2007)]